MEEKHRKKRRFFRSEAAKTARYLLLLGFIRMIRSIPRRWGLLVGKSLALAYWKIGGKQKNRALRHLRMAFQKEKTEREIRETAKKVFLHFGEAGIDAIRIPVYAEKEGFGRLIRPKNFHFAEEALSSGRGAIFLTAHFGNWELMGAWLASLGYPVKVVATPASDSRLDRLIVETRNRAGYYNIARGKNPREIIRSIREGCCLGFLIDQDTDAKGVFVDFFGRKAHTPTAPAVLAARYDIPLIPAFAFMEPDRTCTVEFFPPLQLSDTGDPAADVIANTQKCSDIYETVIRRRPEQWAWMHRRWRKQPHRNPGTGADTEKTA